MSWLSMRKGVAVSPVRARLEVIDDSSVALCNMVELIDDNVIEMVWFKVCWLKIPSRPRYALMRR